jgi:hypothetical protein
MHAKTGADWQLRLAVDTTLHQGFPAVEAVAGIIRILDLTVRTDHVKAPSPKLFGEF